MTFGMPKISAKLLDCAFYLYPTKEAAASGHRFGGTGFFVGVRSAVIPNGYFCYAVTNHHVLTAGNSVIRINMRDGGTDIIPTDPSDWVFQAGGDDLAVLPIPLGDHLKVAYIESDMFATEANVKDLGIGPGDDVFMIGRFVDHDGGATNSPAVRFGNISVDPSIMSDTLGHKSLSYILDIHSRTGYSGSPVFFYRTSGSDLDAAMNGREITLSAPEMRFLGIHYSQFPEEWEIKELQKQVAASSVPAAAVIVDENKRVVVGMSGMTCAIPAWRIMTLLDTPALKKQREAADAGLFAKSAPSALPVPEVSSDNSNHQEDFNNLLDAAVKEKTLAG